MHEQILYTTDGTPIILSQKRYKIAQRYVWHVQTNKKGFKSLFTYFDGDSYTFSNIVFGKRVRRKDPSQLDYTKRNIIGYGDSSRTGRYKKYSNNTSGYKHVAEAANKWTVSIRFKNKLYYKGKFTDKKDAAIVADYWAYRFAGINSYQNFTWPSRRTLVKQCKKIMMKNGYPIDEIIDI